MGVEGLEWDARFDGEGADVILCTRAADATEGVFGGGAEIVQDLVELIDVAGGELDARCAIDR
jgi:hypothetical protein